MDNPADHLRHEDHTDRHFQGQQSTERIHCFCRRHPIILLPFGITWLTLSVVLVAALALVFTRSTFYQSIWLQGLFFSQWVVLTILQHLFFLRILNYYLAIVIVTNTRIIDMEKSIFIQDDKEIIDLHEVQDTKKIQGGIWPNLLNYGDVIVTVSSMLGPMILHYIPNPDYYLNQINFAKRHYIVERRKQKFPQTQETVSGPSQVKPWETPIVNSRSMLETPPISETAGP